MPEDNKDAKPDIVSSIFERRDAKKISSLFTHKSAKTIFAQKPQEPPAKLSLIKKRIPIGLDIGTSSIKAVQLGYDVNNVLKIADLCVEDIPAAARENPKTRIAVIKDTLRRMVETKGLKGADCFTAAPYAIYNVNMLALPQMPANEIDKAVRWEIRQTSDVDLSDLALDYIILEKESRRFLSNQIGVLAVTAAKRDIFEYLAVLQSAGLNPLAIDIDSLCDLAAMEYAKKLNPSEVLLFFDFGAGKTSLNIICDGELVFSRLLSTTGNSLTKAISEYCGLAWEAAEEAKKKFGISEYEDGMALQVRNAILPLLEDMVQDVEHAFKYFSHNITRSQIAAFDRILLSGGTSYTRTFVPFLTKRLGVNVEIFDALSSFEPLDEKEGENLTAMSSRLNVALGLALRAAA